MCSPARLDRSGQIFERKKPCTDPPFLYAEPAEQSNILNGKSVQGFDRIRKCRKFFTVMVPLYGGLCKHLNWANFCTVCTVKAWSLVLGL